MCLFFIMPKLYKIFTFYVFNVIILFSFSFIDEPVFWFLLFCCCCCCCCWSKNCYLNKVDWNCWPEFCFFGLYVGFCWGLSFYFYFYFYFYSGLGFYFASWAFLGITRGIISYYFLAKIFHLPSAPVAPLPKSFSFSFCLRLSKVSI